MKQSIIYSIISFLSVNFNIEKTVGIEIKKYLNINELIYQKQYI
jgi:hypothetical protein